MTNWRLGILVGTAALTFVAGMTCGAGPVSAATPSPLPHQTAPLDIGTTTHGLGGAPAVQPAPRPAIDVRTGDVPASLTQTFWRFRHLPNLLFLHYADLTADLDAELRRLARFLGTPVDERVWPSFLHAASFEAMRARADELAPGAHFNEWRSNRDFFRSARRGSWRASLSPASQALYERLAAERLGPELKAWLEGGRAATGDPAGLP